MDDEISAVANRSRSGRVSAWISAVLADPGSLRLPLALAIVNALALHQTMWVEDDAFIYLRYAEHLLAGHGVRWNIGQPPVEGVTGLSYLLAIVPLRWLGGGYFLDAVHGFNLMLLLAVLVLGSAITRDPASASRWSWTPLLLAANDALAQYSRNGLETTLFAVMICAGLLAWDRASTRGGYALSGLAFGGVIHTRLDGALVCVACWIHELASAPRGQRRRAAERIICSAGALVAAVLPVAVFRWCYFGDLIPNSARAKAVIPFSRTSEGAAGLLDYLASSRGALACLAVALYAFSPRSRLGGVLALSMALWVAYGVFGVGLDDWSIYYMMPLDLGTALLLGASLNHLLPPGGSSRMKWRLATVGGIAVLLSVSPSLRSLLGGVRPPVSQDFVAVGKALGALAAPGDTLATGAAGAIPYYSRLATIDTLGLNDSHIARGPADRRLSFGHQRGDGAYVMSFRPTYLVPYPLLTPQPTRSMGKEKTFREMFAMADFGDHYAFFTFRMPDGRYFNYYKLKSATER
jgi:arabinofuranosyltransferase